MRIIAFVIAVGASILSYADSSPTATRDKALQRINACMPKEASKHPCKKLDKTIQTLVDVYKAGDKSVLPTLLQFTYLTDFYDEALLADPEGFLTAVSQLPDKQQRNVAQGIAGWIYKGVSEQRFQAIRALLTAVPESSPNHRVAGTCLRALEINNAPLLFQYFPSHTLTSYVADFRIHWYSGEMYALGERPLWPPSSDHDSVYRLTLLPAFSGSAVATLTIQPEGTGVITIKSLKHDRETVALDQTLTISHERVAEFLKRLDQAHFWTLPAESEDHGFDGAEWILEGVQDGKYHVVVQWSPDSFPQSPEHTHFAEAAEMLFELAGHKLHK